MELSKYQLYKKTSSTDRSGPNCASNFNYFFDHEYRSGYGWGYGAGCNSGAGYGCGNGYGFSQFGSGYGSGFGNDIIRYWNAALLSMLEQSQVKHLPNDCVLAYWNSDKDNHSANSGKYSFVAKAGEITEVEGPLEICTTRALHGTLIPPLWKGEKTWIVALYPPVIWKHDKCASLKRQIICQVR